MCGRRRSVRRGRSVLDWRGVGGRSGVLDGRRVCGGRRVLDGRRVRGGCRMLRRRCRMGGRAARLDYTRSGEDPRLCRCRHGGMSAIRLRSQFGIVARRGRVLDLRR